MRRCHGGGPGLERGHRCPRCAAAERACAADQLANTSRPLHPHGLALAALVLLLALAALLVLL